MQENELLEVVRHSPKGEGLSGSSTPTAVTLRRNDFRSSTKLDALLQHLSTFNPIVRRWGKVNTSELFIRTSSRPRSLLPRCRILTIYDLSRPHSNGLGAREFCLVQVRRHHGHQEAQRGRVWIQIIVERTQGSDRQLEGRRCWSERESRGPA